MIKPSKIKDFRGAENSQNFRASMKSRIVKPSMALMILFLIFALTASSALTRAAQNVKKIF